MKSTAQTWPGTVVWWRWWAHGDRAWPHPSHHQCQKTKWAVCCGGCRDNCDECQQQSGIRMMLLLKICINCFKFRVFSLDWGFGFSLPSCLNYFLTNHFSFRFSFLISEKLSCLEVGSVFPIVQHWWLQHKPNSTKLQWCNTTWLFTTVHGFSLVCIILYIYVSHC